MIVSGWGRYPKVDCRVSLPQTRGELASLLAEGSSIARGGGRAYGDSAINAANTIDMRCFDQLLDFDPATGVLTAGAGAQLRDILQIFVPRGWFLPVTPGTSFVTIGGAIASDVHGKNHHLVGTFGQHVTEIDLMLGDGDVVTTSPTRSPDLFHATCGGMGLTGVMLSAKLRLTPLTSGFVKQKIVRARDVETLFALFDANCATPYSVAWIDCLATGADLGRSVLLLGEHADIGPLQIDARQPVSMPIDAPAFLLNRWSMRAFNRLYYARAGKEEARLVGMFDFFYPLDAIGAWNRLYGADGFIQYQLVIPKERGAENMRRILSLIYESGEGSFLSVIKLFGAENANLLSFPRGGYTLALDFKLSRRTLELAKALDDMLVGMGGRVYLAKDALLSAETFGRMYPRWEVFESVRQKYRADGKFSSAQSLRLGLR